MEAVAPPALDIYKQITQKLKKRTFFRKANFVEAIEAYVDLLKSLRRGEEDEYSALVAVSLAKCHKQQNNSLMEALYYHRAGRFFLHFQKQISVSQAPTYQESSEMGLECYLAAVSVYLEQKRFAMAASLYYELADFWLSTSRTVEASQYFERAAELQQSENAMSAIASLKRSFECDLLNKNYVHASSILQMIIKLSTEQSTLNSDTFYTDIKIESLVSLCLLLILQGDFEQARVNNRYLQKSHGGDPNAINSTASGKLAKLIRGTSPIHADIFFSSAWFFEMMDALTDAVEFKNEREVLQIQCELSSVLTDSQNQMILGPVLELARTAL
jgi:tetratricopeptide (TPR) repeat protein